MSASPAQVRQWSEEVAADPGAPAFLPLAEAYRAMGRRDAAVRLLLRGLERNPDHVDAHHLLGLLYRDGGEQVKAFDEWDIALRLAPDHGPARREIGLLCTERGEWAKAVRHLERAAANDPADAEVAAALARARTGAGGVSAAPASPSPSAAATPSPSAPWTETPARPASPPSAETAAAPASPAAPVADAAATARAGEGAAPASPATAVPGGETGAGAWAALGTEFAQLSGERGIVGAVLLDEKGYVLAGRMNVDGRDRAPEVAAVLSGASGEAERAVRHLKMGEWRGILLETPQATVRLAPVQDGGMLAIAAGREVPTGWVLRIAARAREAALRALGGGAA
jgi:tetratricopeptide (TPR) repeat protein